MLWDRVQQAPETRRGPMDKIRTAEQLVESLKVLQTADAGAKNAHGRAQEFSYENFSTTVKFG